VIVLEYIYLLRSTYGLSRDTKNIGSLFPNKVGARKSHRFRLVQKFGGERKREVPLQGTITQISELCPEPARLERRTATTNYVTVEDPWKRSDPIRIQLYLLGLVLDEIDSGLLCVRHALNFLEVLRFVWCVLLFPERNQ
jgi:hypothetical protein